MVLLKTIAWKRARFSSLVGERRRVVGGLDLEAVLAAELLDRLDAGGDRVVAEVGDLGEDEHAIGRRLGAGRQGHSESEKQRQQCGDDGDG
ncbi:hypothetical protein RKD30_006461 [Streptomyces pristinaespiralis]